MLKRIFMALGYGGICYLRPKKKKHKQKSLGVVLMDLPTWKQKIFVHQRILQREQLGDKKVFVG